jgi:hypothetical protein
MAEQARHWYRVEHRDGAAARPLGRVPDVGRGPFTLEPYLMRLRRAGVARGALVLVDEATGRDVARRRVRA